MISTRSTVPGHLNGGTNPDVVATNFDPTVDVWVGTGNGTLFEPHWSHDAGPSNFHSLKVLIADLDQNGFGDVVVTGHGLPTPYGTDVSAFSVLLNRLNVAPPY